LSDTVISKNTTVVVAPDQVSSELVDESVILNLKTGMYFGLNEVGASVWQLLQQPKTVADVCAAILEDYDVEAAQCETDILALLEELAEAQLIVIQDEVTA
jgi:hypothetical protein